MKPASCGFFIVRFMARGSFRVAGVVLELSNDRDAARDGRDGFLVIALTDCIGHWTTSPGHSDVSRKPYTRRFSGYGEHMPGTSTVPGRLRCNGMHDGLLRTMEFNDSYQGRVQLDVIGLDPGKHVHACGARSEFVDCEPHSGPPVSLTTFAIAKGQLSLAQSPSTRLDLSEVNVAAP
jgi:hypothetical protein